MKTYISLMISSEGSLASEISEILEDLGFRTTFGSHDFSYDWKKNEVPHSEVKSFIDNVQDQLKGKNVKFNITTLNY